MDRSHRTSKPTPDAGPHQGIKTHTNNPGKGSTNKKSILLTEQIHGTFEHLRHHRFGPKEGC